MAEAPDHVFAAAGVSAGARLVAVRLWRNARSGEPYAWIGTKGLSVALVQDKRTTRRHLEQLVNAGLIRYQRRFCAGAHRRGWSLSSNAAEALSWAEDAAKADATVLPLFPSLERKKRAIVTPRRTIEAPESEKSGPSCPQKRANRPAIESSLNLLIESPLESSPPRAQSRARIRSLIEEAIEVDPDRASILAGEHDKQTRAELKRAAPLMRALLRANCTATGRDPARAKLTPARQKWLRAAFDAGYVPSEVLMAVEGIAFSDHHMGRVRGRPQRYCDLVNALRNAHSELQVETMRDLWLAHHVDAKAAITGSGPELPAAVLERLTDDERAALGLKRKGTA